MTYLSNKCMQAERWLMVSGAATGVDVLAESVLGSSIGLIGAELFILNLRCFRNLLYSIPASRFLNHSQSQNQYWVHRVIQGFSDLALIS